MNEVSPYSSKYNFKSNVILGEAHILGEWQRRPRNRPIWALSALDQSPILRAKPRWAKKVDLKIWIGLRLGVHSCPCWRRCFPWSQSPTCHSCKKVMWMPALHHLDSVSHLRDETAPRKDHRGEGRGFHGILRREIGRFYGGKDELIWISLNVKRDQPNAQI